MSATEKLTYAVGATKKQAIANADAQLADAGLPTYTALAATPATAAPEPLLTRNAKVGNAIFNAGLPERYVIEAAQRQWEYTQTPEGKAERAAELASATPALAALQACGATAAPSEPVAYIVRHENRPESPGTLVRAESADDYRRETTVLQPLYAHPATPQPSAKPAVVAAQERHIEDTQHWTPQPAGAGEVDWVSLMNRIDGYIVGNPDANDVALGLLREAFQAIGKLEDRAEMAEAAHVCAAEERDHFRALATTPAPVKAVAPEAGAPHTDDIAVDEFAWAMKKKLAVARRKGRGGWESCDPAELVRMLRDHVEKGDPCDVANFCMFLWHLDAGTVTPPAAQASTAQDAGMLCALNTDAARLALWQAMNEAEKFANRWDDKVIVEKLSGAGVFLATTSPAAQGAPVEHGQLDLRTATEQARAMVRYCQSFNGQPWGGVDESVDRKNLAVAIDNLEETSAMLLNMAERVAAQGAPVMAEAESGLFVGMRPRIAFVNCTDCGAVNSARNKTCRTCGYSLVDARAAATLKGQAE